jgi:hypothetical protein
MGYFRGLVLNLFSDLFLSDVSQFAPLQRPEQFNAAMLGFVRKILPIEAGDKASAVDAHSL